MEPMIDWREPEKIEVGASRKLLRYWKAKEALRNAELRLASQAAHRTAIEGRATSLFGWATTLAAASITLALGSPSIDISIGAWASAICCLVAGIGAGWTLWPSRWGAVGHNPHDIITSKHKTELEIIESLAIDYSSGIMGNSFQLDLLGNGLRITWIALGCAPLSGLIFSALSANRGQIYSIFSFLLP